MAETVYKESTKSKFSSLDNYGKSKNENDLSPKHYNEAIVSVVDLDTLCELGVQGVSESEVDEQGQVRPSWNSVLFHFVAHKMSVYKQSIATGGSSASDKSQNNNIGISSDNNGSNKGKDSSDNKLYVSKMQFDETGTLLVTADNFGHVFNVFKLHSHINSSKKARAEHLYCLKRGETEANVTDMKWSNDSRLLAVSTSRGTTHVFPIVPQFGGQPSNKTHGNLKIQNKFSDYERSAGLTGLSDDSSIVKEALFLDSVLQIKNNSKVKVSLVSYRKSGDSIFILDEMAKLQQIRIDVENAKNGSSDDPDSKPKFTCLPEKQYNLKRKAEWSSVSPPLSIYNPLAFMSKLTKDKTDSYFLELMSENEDSANAVRNYLSSLYNFQHKKSIKNRVRTSSWNYGSKSSLNHAGMGSSNFNSQEDLSSDQQNKLDLPSHANISKKINKLNSSDNWMSQIEKITCEGDRRGLAMEPQFIFDYNTGQKTTENKEKETSEQPTKPTTRSKKGKNKQKDKEKSQSQNPANSTDISMRDDDDIEDVNYEKTRNAINDALEDEDFGKKDGKSKLSKNYRYKIDDDEHFDLGGDLKVKK